MVFARIKTGQNGQKRQFFYGNQSRDMSHDLICGHVTTKILETYLIVIFWSFLRYFVERR